MIPFFQLLLPPILGIFFEQLPFDEDLLGLDVLDGSQLISVVLVATQRIQGHLLTKSLFVLLLHNLKDVVDLLAIVHFVVIDSHDGVEDSPHHLGVEHLAFVVPDVQTKDYFI